jgi:dCMP deaminase
MFIAIVGPRFSGKTTVEDYLIKEQGFAPVRLIAPNDGESILEGNIGVRGMISFATITGSTPHIIS